MFLWLKVRSGLRSSLYLFIVKPMELCTKGIERATWLPWEVTTEDVFMPMARGL